MYPCYEQLSFLPKISCQHRENLQEWYHDYYGNGLHVGDYVRKIRGNAGALPIEGYVRAIIPCEAAGCEITVENRRGQVLCRAENPLFFEVISEAK